MYLILRLLVAVLEWHSRAGPRCAAVYCILPDDVHSRAIPQFVVFM